MKTTKAKRLLVILGSAVAVLGAYFALYFACVSIQFTTVKEQTLHFAAARYHFVPISDEFARWFFEPARLIDAAYLRPERWKDYQDHPGEADLPLSRARFNPA